MKITAKIAALLYMAVALVGVLAQVGGYIDTSWSSVAILLFGIVVVAWVLVIDFRGFVRARAEQNSFRSRGEMREYCSYCGSIAYGDVPHVHAHGCPRPQGEEIVCTVCEGIGEVPDSAMGWYQCGACLGKGVRPC